MSEIICLKTYQYQHDAELAAGYLNSHGIPATVTTDWFGGYGPLFLYSSGDPVKLLVPTEDAEQAKVLLDEYDKEQAE